MNNLRKRGGNIAVLSKALVKKWKSLVPVENCSAVKKSSPLNTLKSDFKTEHSNISTTKKQSQNSLSNETKVRPKEKVANDLDTQENKTIKKQKVKV